MGTMKNVLRWFALKEDDGWAIICLEHYIGAQGRTLKEAQQRLKTAYRATLDETLRRSGDAFGGIDPAPAHYHDLYREADESLKGSIYDAGSDDVLSDLPLAA